jgi:hypothetical protein
MVWETNIRGSFTNVTLRQMQLDQVKRDNTGSHVARMGKKRNACRVLV